MRNPLARDESGTPNFRTYENNGFMYGAAAGALIGVLIAGPHFFYEWPVWQSLAVVLSCSIGIGILGYIAIASASGSKAAHPDMVGTSGYEMNYSGSDGWSDSSDSGSGCDSGGDCSD